MLETIRALMLRHKAKQEALAIAKKQYEEAKRDIEEEFGDTETPVKEEREKIKVWMIENGFKTQFEPHASVELRKSAPKYIVKDELELKVALASKGEYQALELKKSAVNTLAKEGSIPPSLVEVVQEDEIAITVTDGKGDG